MSATCEEMVAEPQLLQPWLDAHHQSVTRAQKAMASRAALSPSTANVIFKSPPKVPRPGTLGLGSPAPAFPGAGVGTPLSPSRVLLSPSRNRRRRVSIRSETDMSGLGSPVPVRPATPRDIGSALALRPSRSTPQGVIVHGSRQLTSDDRRKIQSGAAGAIEGYRYGGGWRSSHLARKVAASASPGDSADWGTPGAAFVGSNIIPTQPATVGPAVAAPVLGDNVTPVRRLPLADPAAAPATVQATSVGGLQTPQSATSSAGRRSVKRRASIGSHDELSRPLSAAKRAAARNAAMRSSDDWAALQMASPGGWVGGTSEADGRSIDLAAEAAADAAADEDDGLSQLASSLAFGAHDHAAASAGGKQSLGAGMATPAAARGLAQPRRAMLQLLGGLTGAARVRQAVRRAMASDRESHIGVLARPDAAASTKSSVASAAAPATGTAAAPRPTAGWRQGGLRLVAGWRASSGLAQEAAEAAQSTSKHLFDELCRAGDELGAWRGRARQLEAELGEARRAAAAERRRAVELGARLTDAREEAEAAQAQASAELSAAGRARVEASRMSAALIAEEAEAAELRNGAAELGRALVGCAAARLGALRLAEAQVAAVQRASDEREARLRAERAEEKAAAHLQAEKAAERAAERAEAAAREAVAQAQARAMRAEQLARDAAARAASEAAAERAAQERDLQAALAAQAAELQAAHEAELSKARAGREADAGLRAQLEAEAASHAASLLRSQEQSQQREDALQSRLDAVLLTAGAAAGKAAEARGAVVSMSASLVDVAAAAGSGTGAVAAVLHRVARAAAQASAAAEAAREAWASDDSVAVVDTGATGFAQIHAAIDEVAASAAADMDARIEAEGSAALADADSVRLRSCVAEAVAGSTVSIAPAQNAPSAAAAADAAAVAGPVAALQPLAPAARAVHRVSRRALAAWSARGYRATASATAAKRESMRKLAWWM